MTRWWTRSHAWLYRRSGGRILGRIGGQPVLLLETTGRRSGRTRTTPVQYAARGEDFIIVAADHGARHHPAWYLNLRANAVGRVRVREQNFDVATREASGDERTALWRELSAANRYLPRLQTKARRQLPLLLLTPTKAPGSNRAIEGGRGAARRSDSGHSCSTPATAPLAETSPASSDPPTVISKEKT